MFRIFHVGAFNLEHGRSGQTRTWTVACIRQNPQPHNISFDLKFQMKCLSISSAKCWYYYVFLAMIVCKSAILLSVFFLELLIRWRDKDQAFKYDSFSHLKTCVTLVLKHSCGSVADVFTLLMLRVPRLRYLTV